MLGDERLRDAERVDELVDATFLRGAELDDDAEAHRTRECPEQISSNIDLTAHERSIQTCECIYAYLGGSQTEHFDDSRAGRRCVGATWAVADPSSRPRTSAAHTDPLDHRGGARRHRVCIRLHQHVRAVAKDVGDRPQLADVGGTGDHLGGRGMAEAM